MNHPNSDHAVLTALEKRKSVNNFEHGVLMPLADIKAMIHYASQAPSSSNLQHWRFLALTDQQQKDLLRSHAFDQRKISDAAVTFIVLADLRAADEMPKLTDDAIRAQVFGEDMRSTWEGLAAHYRDPQISRDEALRSAALASMNLMTAADAMGYGSGAVGGFDPQGIRQAFDIPEHFLISLIVCVGVAGRGNWIKKPRKPVNEILFVNRMPRVRDGLSHDDN